MADAEHPEFEVRGHLCGALRAFQEAAHGCDPDFTWHGHVRGCDSTHGTPITHCPFCGAVLERAHISH